jgi:DNA-binding Xre family transcriptional regulator
MKTKKLLKLMIDREHTIQMLADKTEVTSAQVRRIVSGESNGSVKWWKKAAEVLGCELSDIVE